MGMENLSENVILVVLPAEPLAGDELKMLNELVSNRCDFDVIIDLSKVEILTSPSISNLLILHDWLSGSGHKLILCNVSFATKSVFVTAGLDKFFDFAHDKFAALTAMQPAKPTTQ